MKKYIHGIKKYALYCILITLSILLIYSVGEYIFVVLRSIIRHFLNAIGNGLLHKEGTLILIVIQQFMAGALLLMVLIELLESIYYYIKHDNTLYTRIVLEIVLISVLRHVIILDIAHTDYKNVIGLSLLVLVIGSFYLIFKKYFPNKLDQH